MECKRTGVPEDPATDRRIAVTGADSWAARLRPIDLKSSLVVHPFGRTSNFEKRDNSLHLPYYGLAKVVGRNAVKHNAVFPAIVW